MMLGVGISRPRLDLFWHGKATIPNREPLNGRSVFLSPAGHGPKFGCDGYEETENMRLVAEAAANNLRGMGYLVYVGNGTADDNTTTSNSLSPQLHVPIHSNAGMMECSDNEEDGAGTQVYYSVGSADGQAASEALLAALREGSPGSSSERLCQNNEECNSFVIPEVESTTAPVAYVEAAFHTFRPDTNWLRGIEDVASRTAEGINVYFNL